MRKKLLIIPFLLKVLITQATAQATTWCVPKLHEPVSATTLFITGNSCSVLPTSIIATT